MPLPIPLVSPNMDARDALIKDLLVHLGHAMDLYREQGNWSRLKDIGWTLAFVETEFSDTHQKPFWKKVCEDLRKDFF